MTIGRFAPSPSGRMHLGNAMTALLAWLSVRSQGGTMVLRMEDLDVARCKPAYLDQLKRDLEWLRLDWDMEQTKQSERTSAYEEVFQNFQEKGLIYPCYCSRADLHAASAPHRSDGQLVYPGTCRSGQAVAGKVPSWRIVTPDRVYGFVDGLQGEYAENLQQDCGDFIVRRSDGIYAYQLAVVCDDAQGNINEVVRGVDLLDSTPRQLYLYELLGKNPPKFYHTPLLTAPDGRRLSKRDGDLDLGALKERYTGEEIIGKLAKLLCLQDCDSAISPQELIGSFSWSKIPKSNVPIFQF